VEQISCSGHEPDLKQLILTVNSILPPAAILAKFERGKETNLELVYVESTWTVRTEKSLNL